MPKKPTIVDVAERAGVSTATVSNVLNGTARVSPETRSKVEDAVETLGYVPNPLARSLNLARQSAVARTVARAAPRLTSVGYLSVDYTAEVDVLPHRDDRIAARGIEKSLGGPAANVAVIAANVGEPFGINTELVTAIGDDQESEWALAELASKQVETVGIRRRPGQRLSRCVIVVEPNGSRMVINEPVDLNESDLHRYVEAVPDKRRRHCLHLEGYQVDRMFGSAMSLRANGWLLSLQSTGLPASRLNPDGLKLYASSFHVVFLSQKAAMSIAGGRVGRTQLLDRMSVLLRGYERGLVIIILGEDGAAIFPPGEATYTLVSAPDVEVIDRTGAGDAFIGAFLAVWLNTADTMLAARYGCIAGAMLAAVPHAQGVLPTAVTMQKSLPAAKLLQPRDVAATAPA